MTELFNSEAPQADGASSSSAPSACAAVNIVKIIRAGSAEAVPTAALAVFQFTSSDAAVAFFRRNHGRRLTLPASKERE
jgi:hypothetical protein